MHKLLIATNNQGKVKEIQTILFDLNITLLTPQSINLRLNVVEDGTTYSENATKKARAFATASGLPTLADDSGLEVDALNGMPGIYSARYAPVENATDAIRRQYLLQQLAEKPRPWKARFRCVIAFIAPDDTLHHSEGICEGEIIPDERGSNGFGYDPIFLLPTMGKTMAELTLEEKNRVSHRATALQQLKPLLVELIKL